MTAAELARALNGRRSGQQWAACCPAHDDAEPSLTIGDGEHGVVVRCHAGCSQSQVLAALRNRGLWSEPEDTSAPPPRHNGGNGSHGNGADIWHPILPVPAGTSAPPEAMLHCDMLHEYRDAEDRLLCYVRRIEGRSGRRKQFLPLTFGWLDSKLAWQSLAPDKPRPLYGLNRLSHADPAAVVLVCEGEKAADAAMRLFPDHAAMAWMGGASAVATADWGPLAKRSVIIWADADEPGRKAAGEIAKLLPRARVLDTARLADGFDAADLEMGDEADDPLRWLEQRLPESTSQVGRILPGAAFMARHVPPLWLIDGIIQRGRLYSCTSLTGHGKTAVWLHNACMIQAGRPIGNRETFQGNVLYLAGENPADLEARMIGTTRTHNLPASKLPYVLPGGFPLTEDEIEALKREIAGLRVPLALIVGDTASSFFPGDDENSNVQSGQYARALRGLSDCEGHPAVMMLTHPVKNASRSNLLPRGGGAFLNEVDGNLTTWSEVTGELTELHWQGKIRGPDFSPFGYRLRSVPTGLSDEKGRPEVTIIAEPMSEEAVADHAKQALANEDVVLRALRDHPDWSLAQIARDAGWVDSEQQPEKWRAQRTVRALVEDKLIEKRRAREPWKLTEKGRKILSSDD